MEAPELEAPAVELEEPVETPPLAKECRNEENAKATVTRLLDTLRQYASYRTENVEEIWDACKRAYEGWAPDDYPWQRAYIIREIFRQIETLKPQCYLHLFGADPNLMFQFTGRVPDMDEHMAAATSIVHKQLNTGGGKAVDAMTQWVDSALMYGVGYCYAGWETLKRTRLKISKMHTPVKDEDRSETWWQRKTEDVERGLPFVRNLTPWQVWTHPKVRDPNDSPVFFFRDDVTPAHLKTLVRDGYLDRDAVKRCAEMAGSRGSTEQSKAETDPEFAFYDAFGDDPIQMLTCWTNDGWEYVILNEEVLARAYPERPAVRCLINYPQDDRHYGFPEPFVILDDQNLLNDFMGMWVEGVHFTMSPMVKGPADAVQAWQRATIQPGGWVQVDNPDRLQPVQMNPSVLDMPGIANFILGNAQVSTGVTPEWSGTGSRTRTATQHVDMRQAAGVRLTGKMTAWQRPLGALYMDLYLLNQRYLNAEEFIRFEGRGGGTMWKRVGPEVFELENDAIEVDVRVAGQIDIGPDAAARWQTLLQQAANDPTVDRRKLWEQVFRAHGVSRPRHYFVDPAVAEQDAMNETSQAFTLGYVDVPRPGEDHQTHLMIHMQALQTMSPPASLVQHAATHMQYLKAQQRAQAAAAGAAQGPQESGSPVPAQDGRTEALFQNGPRGAREMGVLPGGRV